MKSCRVCKSVKPLADFHKKPDSKDGLQNCCKVCAIQILNQWRSEHKQQAKDGAKAGRVRLKILIGSLKERPCMDCGMQYEPSCMEFDHREGETKIAGDYRLTSNGCTVQRNRDEIAKCDLLCVLCHRTRTHLRRQPAVPQPSIDRNRRIITLAKSHPCAICGLQRHHWQMDFDHVGPKEANVASMVTRRRSVGALSAEMQKCQVVCVLCHRRKSGL